MGSSWWCRFHRRPSSASGLVELRRKRSRRRRMSRRSGHGESQKLDLKLNLALPTRGDTSRRMATTGGDDSPRGSSSPSSCLSSEADSPEGPSMVLAGCPRCLMYVMLPGDDPKCPKCKSAVLLDFLHDTTTTSKKSRKT
ncbi:hypothetical protein MUK42_02448 [Musa troglodytarum]|uniref:GIR1-like zinc ribbon domain-containing protein n=1 Tax=Musa troglodytarum TaxID=320322 RepID=A0A9E7EU71_9LILI|nr:hypothetical protein MUK42_02448 [Musa troglodytarum]